jgi:transposase InsO family protein
VSRFQFVADHRDTFEVKRLCEVIEVNRSSFYAWDAATEARAERQAADAELAERIRVVHEADKAYGAPRVTAELNDGAPPGKRVNRKRVARVMAEHGIAGIRLRRRVRTTIPEPCDEKVPDLLKRDFTAETPNTKYVGDITYLPLADGSNLYLATVIDCCSRKLAGWAVADHMRTELVETALKAALADRGSLRGAIFHADHGAQGGFQRSSQHLDDGGVSWLHGRRLGRVVGGSGQRIERCGRRCGHRDAPSRRVPCRGRSGV